MTDRFEEELANYLKVNFPDGKRLCFEVHNESHHGQAAVNVLNGLPPDADPKEAQGSFNSWLLDLIPRSGDVG